jgi:ubiquinone/menaquinone biosynthesis C-methylase UbiE
LVICNAKQESKVKANWIVILFVALTDASLRLRQKLWRWVYDKIASSDSSGQFVFMNYGYKDNDKHQSLSLKHEDEPFRYFIQLYDFVVSDINLNDKDIMEVGCGRGGGGAFILAYKSPHSFTGIDLSETAINWCKQHIQFNNSNWMQGLADALPVSDESMDIVINVESSHCYPSMDNFLTEVKRTLKPGGYLVFCDLRRLSLIDDLKTAMAKSGLDIIKYREITPQVLNALKCISQTRDEQITSVFPSLLRPAIRDFAAVKDTAIYKMLETGQMKYFFYLLKKKSS